MKTRRVKRFDLKIGSVITPHELANVFQFIGGSSCKIDRMSVDQMTQFIEDRTKVARKCGDPDPNLIRIEGGPFFQLKNVTFVEPWKHTEMVIDMEDKNEK